ncbi:MAG: hypothetical protein IJQ56_09955, partial [Synergistaceae bacterium]|nr:hypothetical protein [Synergistaceae bacterium]
MAHVGREFKSPRLHPVLAELLSNVALLVIGEGAVVENRYDSSIFSDLHVLNFLGEMNDRSESLDETFITPLKNVFHASKYTRLCQHFTLFKEAHLNPIFGTLISDKNLLNLVLGTIRLKIGEDLSLSEALTWRRHHEIIINYLEPCLAMPGDNIDDYEDSIALAFGKS